MKICVDFDGTIITHKYPHIGEPVPWALETLKELADLGHHIILFTMRSGKQLDDAVEYIEAAGIKLFGINKNPGQKAWTESPKVYAELYIDDAAVGCPLIYPSNCERPYVDWLAVRILLSQDERIGVKNEH